MFSPDHHHREIHSNHEEFRLGEVTVSLNLVGEGETDRDREVGRGPCESAYAYRDQIDCDRRIIGESLEEKI